jgi:hypothetical protein
MGAFNTLVTDVQCSNCNNTYKGNIQFKYGDTWQFEYKLGDKLKWGGNDIGISGSPKVKVYGILHNDTCPICHQINLNEEFDIYVENDIITSITRWEIMRIIFQLKETISCWNKEYLIIFFEMAFQNGMTIFLIILYEDRFFVAYSYETYKKWRNHCSGINAYF